MGESVNANVRHLGVPKQTYEDKAGIWKPGTGLDYKNTLTDIVNIFMKRLLGNQGNTQITIGDQLTLDATIDDTTNAEDYKTVDAALKKAFKDINEAKKFREFLSKILNGTLSLPQTFKTISGVNITISAGPAEASKAAAPAPGAKAPETPPSGPMPPSGGAQPIVAAPGVAPDAGLSGTLADRLFSPYKDKFDYKKILAEKGKITWEDIKDSGFPRKLFDVMCKGMVDGIKSDESIDNNDIKKFESAVIDVADLLFPPDPRNPQLAINKAIELYRNAVVFHDVNIKEARRTMEAIFQGGPGTLIEKPIYMAKYSEIRDALHPALREQFRLKFIGIIGKEPADDDTLLSMSPDKLEQLNKSSKDDQAAFIGFRAREMCRWLATLALVEMMGDKQPIYWAMMYPEATPEQIQALMIRKKFPPTVDFTAESNLAYLRAERQATGPTGPDGNPVVTGPDGKPVVTGPDGKPVVTGPDGKPVVTGPDGKPVVTGPDGKPVVTGPDGKPVVTGPDGKPVVTGPDGKPVVTAPKKPAPGDLVKADSAIPSTVMTVVMADKPSMRDAKIAKIIKDIKGTSDPKKARDLVTQYVNTNYSNEKIGNNKARIQNRDALLTALSAAA